MTDAPTEDDATDRGDGGAGHEGDDVGAQLLRRAYGLDDDGLVGRRRVLAAAERVAAEGAGALDGAELAGVARALAIPGVAASLADSLGGSLPGDPRALEAVAAAVADAPGDADVGEDAGPGRHAGAADGAGGATSVVAGAAYLQACCAEHAGRASDAERHVDVALEADPTFEPALLEAAAFAEDRGDARRAVTLLRRAGVDNDDAQLVRVQAWTSRPPAQRQAGRNEPCPCGSGRKFKKCCATRQGHPLEARAGWLLDKAEAYAARSRHRSRLLPLVEARAGDPRDDQRLAAATRDPLIGDLALFDAGLLADFVAERGELLPADELDLACRWLGVRRGCYEVVDADPRRGVGLVDLRGEQRVTVWPGPDSRDLQPGQTVFARVLPAGDAHLLGSGPVAVPPAQRGTLPALADTGPDAVCQAAWAAALEGAPALVTVDGEALVACRAVFDLADADADEVRSGLSARFAAVDRRRWVERADLGGRSWPTGTVTLDGDRLVVEASAVSRFEALTAAVAGAAPRAALVDETRRPAAEVLGGAGPIGGVGP